MTQTEQTWDIALTPMTKGGGYYNLPAPLAHALKERGMWRASLTVTDGGFLIKPYESERRQGTKKNLRVELPF